jgi:hypothetical protein
MKINFKEIAIMWNTTIATNMNDLIKVVNHHLKYYDEIKLERGTGIYGEDVAKILWRNKEEDED